MGAARRKRKKQRRLEAARAKEVRRQRGLPKPPMSASLATQRHDQRCRRKRRAERDTAGKEAQQAQQPQQPPTPVMLMPTAGGPVVVQQAGGLPQPVRSGQVVSLPATTAGSASAASGPAQPPPGPQGAAAAAGGAAQQMQQQQQQQQPQMVNGQKVCKTEGCGQPAAKRSPYCPSHTGARHCQYPGCTKCAQGNTKFCIAHGGGRRCTYPGCTKGARDKNFCAAHGGGKRCCIDGCTKVRYVWEVVVTVAGGVGLFVLRRAGLVGIDLTVPSTHHSPITIERGGRLLHVHGARRGAALPVPGLHALGAVVHQLLRAPRRGPQVPGRGLPEGACDCVRSIDRRPGRRVSPTSPT